MYDLFNFCGLTQTEYWLVIRLYSVVLITLILSLYYIFIKRKVSISVMYTLISAFLITAFGWELWLTYGLAGGIPVDLRRSAMLTCAVPVNLNWILNSIGDVLVVWIGLYVVKLVYRNKKSPFLKWSWGAFTILFFWFLAQNIYVEAFFYHLQIGENGDLSWAPFSPLGSWFNPTIFELLGRPITFQSQISWVLMTPVIYLLSIYFDKKYKNKQFYN